MPKQEPVLSREPFFQMIRTSGAFDFTALQKTALEKGRQAFIDLIIHPSLAGLGVYKGALQEGIKGRTGRLTLNEERETMFDLQMSEIIYPLVKPGEHSPHKSQIFRIGRNRENDVVVADFSISEQHAMIRFIAGSAVLIDAGSSNGTDINGMQLQSREMVELHDGDEIRIGRFLFSFIYPDSLYDRLNRTAVPRHIRELLTPSGRINYAALKAFALLTDAERFTSFLKHPLFMGAGLFRGVVLPRLPTTPGEAERDTLIFAQARPMGGVESAPITVPILEKSIFALYERRTKGLGQVGSVLTIGRDPACDIVLGDAAISKLHARLHIEEFAFYLEDCGSTNGLEINGRPCGSGEKKFLGINDQVRFGRYLFQFIPPTDLHKRLVRIDPLV